MFENKDLMIPRKKATDPVSLLRQMTSELDRVFDEAFFPSFQWPKLRQFNRPIAAAWLPKVEMFEKDNRLVTKMELPGLKKEDVTVEVAEGHLVISGERKYEIEEKKENVYRNEREYGTFYRALPLPEGVKLEDVKATFADGVLQVTIPLPLKPELKVRKVEVLEPAKIAKTAA